MILGGSTNAVLHLIAIAHSVGIELTLDDFQSVSDRTPFIANLKPSGQYVMEDVYKLGGIPSTACVIFKMPRHELTPIRRNPGVFTQKQPYRRQQHDHHRSHAGREPREVDPRARGAFLLWPGHYPPTRKADQGDWPPEVCRRPSIARYTMVL